MKITISNRQFRKLCEDAKYGLLETTTDSEGALRLDIDKDLSDIQSLHELTGFTKGSALKFGEKSKTRKLGIEISNILSNLENSEDRELFENYFLKIKDLLNPHHKPSAFKKLEKIISELVSKDINVAKVQMESIISIFEDPRFEESHKKKLIKMLSSEETKLDLDDFFEETKKFYQEYEDSFAKGENTPFKEHRTSPKIKVKLAKDFLINNCLLSTNSFNEQKSDVSKVIEVIKLICSCKTYADPYTFIENVANGLKFKIEFDDNEDNIKADLILKNSLNFDSGGFRPETIAHKGKFIEVKYKPYDEPSYLSEFFKVDASDSGYNALVNAFEPLVKKYEGSAKSVEGKQALTILLKGIVQNLNNTLVKSPMGENIIDHLTKNLAGIIFKNNVFVQKENIKFYWNTIGYASRARLSIWYEVKDSELWELTQDSKGHYTTMVTPIN